MAVRTQNEIQKAFEQRFPEASAPTSSTGLPSTSATADPRRLTRAVLRMLTAQGLQPKVPTY